MIWESLAAAEATRVPVNPVGGLSRPGMVEVTIVTFLGQECAITATIIINGVNLLQAVNYIIKAGTILFPLLLYQSSSTRSKKPLSLPFLVSASFGKNSSQNLLRTSFS